jgi:membrane associated rhomboid family serine protease
VLPISDENPTRITPIINYAIIVSCFGVFIWQTLGGTSHFLFTLYNFGVIPQRILMGEGLYTLVTNTFLHGGWSHLLGNMLFLWIFGDNIEDNIVCRSNVKFIGQISYLTFYLICGVAASAFWMLTDLSSPYPAVGASGAIAGVLGAYFIFYPTRRIRTLVGIGDLFRIIRVRAYTMIGIWFVYQFLMAMSPFDTGVAFWAHVGGFIMGILLAMLMRRRPRHIQTYYSSDLEEIRYL